MGDRMTPIPFGNLMNWAMTERAKRQTVFGVRKEYKADPAKCLSIFGEKIETPYGPGGRTKHTACTEYHSSISGRQPFL